MSGGAGEVFRTVEYGREKWHLNRVPLALLGCIAGLVMLALDPVRPGVAPLVFPGLLLALAAVAAISTYAMNHVLDRLPAWSIGAVLVLGLGLLVVTGAVSRPSRSLGSAMPLGTFGWMVLFFSLGYIAFALWRHFRPARPMVSLSPAGLSFNISWLKNLLIPWYEVEHVGTLEHVFPTGVVLRHVHNPVVVVSQEFYEASILPRRSLLSGNLWSGMFQPKGAQMQILLPYPWFAIDMNDMLAPVDVRWKAFREPPMDAPPDVIGPPVRFGAWSRNDLTAWKTLQFVIPLAGILALLAQAGGLWDSPALREARETSAKKRQMKEEARRESQRLREELERSGIKIGR